MKDISESDETLSSNFSAPNSPSNRDADSTYDPSAAPSSSFLPPSKPPLTAASSVNAFKMDRHAALPPRSPQVHFDGRAISSDTVGLKPPGNETSSQHLKQPSLETELSQQRDRSASKSRRLSLEDFLQAAGSFEQQSETQIFKALEDRYPKHYNPQRLDDTTTSSILSQVPESASHDFTMSPVVTDRKGDNTTSGSPERDNTEEGDMKNQSPQPTTMRSRRLSKQTSMRSSQFSNQQQIKPKAGRASMTTRRRKLTVEQTLSDMTSAMSALHDERPSNRFNDRNPDGDDSFNSDSEENNYAYKNATALSRVQGAKAPNMNKAKDRWGHLRRNLPAAVEIEAEVVPATNQGKNRWNHLRDNLPAAAVDEVEAASAPNKATDRWNHLRGNISAARANEEAVVVSTPNKAKDRWGHLRRNLSVAVVNEEIKMDPPPITGNLFGNLHSPREVASHEPTPDDCETSKHQGNAERDTEAGYGVPEDSGESSEEGSVGTEGGRKPSRVPQTNFSQGVSSKWTREQSNRGSNRKLSRSKSLMSDANDKIKENWEVWKAFILPRKDKISIYIKKVPLYLMLPAGVIAAILFYFCGNPLTETGKGTSESDSQDGASVSWWLIFMCVRQVLTFSLALGLQIFIIDFLSLGTRLMLRFAGPVVTLLVVSSKGWPFIVFWWALIDFAALHGDGAFAKHWFLWQNAIDMFNSNNPSGNIVNNEWYTVALKMGIFVSLVVAIKRFIFGLYLGKQTFSRFSESLADVMKKMLLISQVAGLANEIEKDSVAMDKTSPVTFGHKNRESLRGVDFAEDFTSKAFCPNEESLCGAPTHTEEEIDTSKRCPTTGGLHPSEKLKLMRLLDQWEEPDRRFDRHLSGGASISAVLKFRKALTFTRKRYPFSFLFGPADSREACIDSAQAAYERLMLCTPSETLLPFETIALLALNETSEIDQEMAKDLVKLFRPDREGYLTMLDFVKSVDSVYKEFRLLSASIENSARLDRSFESLMNGPFYALVTTIILIQLGFDPLALFLSLSGVILAFGFIIGSASAKYFEGLLFILIRRPYDIGDTIHISNVEKQTSFDGSPGWVVENITLFETTAINVLTNERCSLSNGSLANSRIMNAARSMPACMFISLKFPLDTPFENILIFKTAMMEYTKERPREWLGVWGFRISKVVTEEGYIEYFLILQHREKWQFIYQIYDSKANIISYCLAVMKQLDMHYHAPPLPVDLKYSPAIPIVENIGNENASMNNEARAEMFRSLALKTKIAG